MSPAKSTAARKPGKAAKGKGAPKAKPKGKPKRAKPAAVRSAAAPKPAKAARAAPTAGNTGHAHCAASDPFGDPCQNLPRRPSKYCVIHSYLER